MIVYCLCLNVLAQLNTQSKRTYLQISRYLKAAFWKASHKGFKTKVALVKGYSKKEMFTNSVTVFPFLFLREKIIKIEHQNYIFGTVVTIFQFIIIISIAL